MSKHDHDHAHAAPAHGAAAHGSPDHGAAEHAGDHPTRSTFVTIWLILAFLTVIEVFVPQVYAGRQEATLKMLLLVILASGKADANEVEILGLFWHFVDLVWILVFTFIYLL